MNTQLRLLLLLLSLSLLAACSDGAITARPVSFNVQINQPGDGAEFIQGDQVALTGQVIDFGQSRTGREIVATWLSDVDNQIDFYSFDEEEELVFTTTATDLSVGEHLLTFEVTIDQAEPRTTTAGITIIENTAPVVSITSPEEGGFTNQGDVLTLDLLASDQQSDPEELVVTWTSNQVVNPIVEDRPIESNGQSPFPIDTLEEGEHVLTATVRDPQGMIGTDEVTISVMPPNAPPQCSIDAPATEISLEVDVDNTFLVQVTAIDPDGDNTELEATLSGNATVFGVNNPSPAGNVSFQVIELPSGEHAIDLEVEDPRGGTCTDSIIVNVSTRPTATITQPAANLTFTLGDAVTFAADVSDIEDLPPSLGIQWSSDQQGVLDTTSADASGLVTFSTTAMSAGLHNVTLTAGDTSGLEATDTVQISINEQPTVTFLQPTAALFTEGDDVLFELQVSDPETVDPSTLLVDLVSSNGGPILTAVNPDSLGNLVFNASNLNTGSHTVTATVTDGFSAQGTDVVVFTMNTIPVVNITSPTDNQVFSSGSVVTFSGTVADPEDDVAGLMGSLTVSWDSDLNGQLNTDPPVFDGVDWSMTFDSTSLSAPLTEAQHTLTLSVTDSNGAVGQNVITFALNEPPTAPVVDLQPPFPTTIDNLNVVIATPSTDPEGGLVTYDYQWYVNAVHDPTYDGLTTVPSAATTHFEDWEVVVTAIDDVGNTTPVTSNLLSILNSPPYPATLGQTDPELDMTTAQEGDTITCQEKLFFDNDPTDVVSVSYTWLVNGSPISSTASTLTGADFDKGDIVTCEVLYDDSFDTVGPYLSSNQTTIINTPPTAPVVSISPASPSPSDPLVCNIATPAFDPDPADTITYDYTWYLATILDPETSNTLSSTVTEAGQTWSCEAVADDGEDYGPVSSQDSVLIGGCVWTGPVAVSNQSPADTWICGGTSQLALDGDGLELGMRNDGAAPNSATFGITSQFVGATFRADFGAVDASMQVRLVATAIDDPTIQICGDTCNGANCNTPTELLVFVSDQPFPNTFTYWDSYTVPFGSYLDQVIDFTGTNVQYVTVAVDGALGPDDPNVSVDLLGQCL